MHQGIVFRYVGSGDFILIFLTFYMRPHVSPRLPDTLEKGTNHCLFGLRFMAWLVTFAFSSHSPRRLSRPMAVVTTHWRAGLDMDPTDWRGEKWGSQPRTMRTTRFKQITEPFPSLQVPLPQPLPKSSGNFQGQSNAFCNSDSHRVVFQYFITF